MVQHLTDATFVDTVQTGIALVDFWASWCGPCRVLSPVIEGLAETYAGTVRVCKLNIDTNPDVPRRLGIKSVPTIMLFKDGDLVYANVGIIPKSVLTEELDRVLTGVSS